MENANGEELRQWVVEQTALLAPPAGWLPDWESARLRFDARRETDARRTAWPRWTAMAAAALLVVALVLLVPGWRAAAQQFWQLLTVRQLAFIKVNPWPEDVPSPGIALIGRPIPPIPARDVEDARWRVHYDARLPHFGVLRGSPRLSTTFSISAGAVVRVADLELALRRAGVTDQTVPPEWDGAQIVLRTSGIVIAEWSDTALSDLMLKSPQAADNDIALVQSLPLTLTVPQGFDFAAFSALVLRVMGVGPEEARRLAQEAGTVPPWLVPLAGHLPLDQIRGGIHSSEWQTVGGYFRGHATLEEIKLNSGPGTLLQKTGDDGAVIRTSILWSVPDRVYLLSGKLSRELAISAANAVE